MFFDILLYCASQSQAYSLSQTSSRIKSCHRLRIAKQSIDGRFTEEAVTFVKEVLKELLERQLSNIFCAGFLSQFNHVRIKDSTRFNVPDNLKAHFKGSGGNKGTSRACVCIQYEYDARSGKILDLNVTDGTRNDSTDARETKEKIHKGDLVLRDLGYFNLSVLAGFVSEGASFISRLNASILVYETETQTRIGFKELYEHMCKGKMATCEKQVFMGREKQAGIRLIIKIVPEQIYEERIRRVNKYNKENGWTTSEEHKARCRFNLFITNVPEKDLSTEEVMLLYYLRWQIELMFKNWKSVCRIDKIQPMKYARFACLLFAKLILILLKMQVITHLQAYYYKKNQQILSENKCFKTLQESFSKIRCIWRVKKKRSEKELMNLLSQFSTNHWKEKRKNKLNLDEIINLFTYKSIKYEYI